MFGRKKITSNESKIQDFAHKTFVTIMITSVIVSFSLVALQLLYGQWRFNNEVESAKREANQQLEENIANADELKESFTKLEEAPAIIPGQDKTKTNAAIVLDALPSKYDFPAIATSMEVLAEKSKVDLTGFNGSDEEVNAVSSQIDPSPIEIEYSVTVEGTYAEIEGFMENVENSIRPITVLSAVYSGESDNMTGSFDMITYYQPTVNLDVNTRTVE